MRTERRKPSERSYIRGLVLLLPAVLLACGCDSVGPGPSGIDGELTEVWSATFPSDGRVWVSMCRNGRVVAGGAVTEPGAGSVFGYSPSGSLCWESHYDEWVRDVAASRCGDIVAVACQHQLWVMAWGGEVLWTREFGRGGVVISASVSADGERIFATTTGYYDSETDTYSGGQILAFSASGDTLWTRLHTCGSWEVDASADGLLLGAGPADGTARLLGQSGNDLWSATVSSFGRNRSQCSIAQDGSYLLVGSDDPQVVLLDGQGNELWSQYRSFHPIAVSMSPRGEAVITAVRVGADRGICLFDRAGAPLDTLLLETGASSIDISEFGRVAVGVGDVGVSVLQIN